MYPHQYKEGQVPLMLLRDDICQKLERLEARIAKDIAKEFVEKVRYPTMDQVQLVYEHYCQEFNATPFKLRNFIKKTEFIMKNQQLPLGQVKALCLAIPILAGINHVVFQKNNVADELGPALLFACFMNPGVS